MYYYYDVLLNFGADEELFEFYEWESDDNVEFVKKIPLFRVTLDCLIDNLKYKTKFDSSLVEQIKEKTIIKGSLENINSFLISDSKNALALEINEEGEVISRSKLLPSDELNISEVMFTMRESTLHYEKLEKYPNVTSLRQERKIKKLIKQEIDTLYKEKNVSKLKYLYYEWFNKNNDNIEKIYKTMTSSLQKGYNDNLRTIYDFIKLSYHNMH